MAAPENKRTNLEEGRSLGVGPGGERNDRLFSNKNTGAKC